MEFLVFQFVATVSFLLTRHCWEESGSIVFTPLTFIHIDEITPSLFFYKLNGASSLSLSLYGRYSDPLIPFVVLWWIHSSMSMFTSLFRFLWMAAQPYSMSATPHSFALSAHLLRVHAVYSSQQVINENDRIVLAPVLTPGLPLMSGFQMDFVLLVTTF